jgi:hypothetical protein
LYVNSSHFSVLLKTTKKTQNLNTGFYAMHNSLLAL